MSSTTGGEQSRRSLLRKQLVHKHRRSQSSLKARNLRSIKSKRHGEISVQTPLNTIKPLPWIISTESTQNDTFPFNIEQQQSANTPSMPSIATFGELSNVSSDETIDKSALKEQVLNEFKESKESKDSLESKLHGLHWISDLSLRKEGLGNNNNNNNNKSFLESQCEQSLQYNSEMSDSYRCDFTSKFEYPNTLTKNNSLKVVITPMSTISNISIDTPLSDPLPLTPQLTPVDGEEEPRDLKEGILRQSALERDFVEIEDSYDAWSLQPM